MSKRERSPGHKKATKSSSKKKASTSKDAQQDAVIEKLVKQVRQQEALAKRGVDVPMSISTVINTSTTNGDMFLLNPVQEGDQIQNRAGRDIKMKSLRVRGQAAMTSANVALIEGNILRMSIVYDSRPGANLPLFNEIFAVTDGAGTESVPAAAQVWCPPRYDNMKRFTILRDVVLDINVEANIGTTGTTFYHAFDEFIKLPESCSEASFSATANPITTSLIVKGALYAVFRALGSGPTASININCVSRLRFY